MKDYIFTLDFWKKAVIRGIHTFAQTALAMLAIGQTFHEIDWVHILSVSGVAFVISLLKSVVAGIPEADAKEIVFTPDEDFFEETAEETEEENHDDNGTD